MTTLNFTIPILRPGHHLFICLEKTNNKILCFLFFFKEEHKDINQWLVVLLHTLTIPCSSSLFLRGNRPLPADKERAGRPWRPCGCCAPSGWPHAPSGWPYAPSRWPYAPWGHRALMSALHCAVHTLPQKLPCLISPFYHLPHFLNSVVLVD